MSDPIAGFLARRVAEGRMPGAAWRVEVPGGAARVGAVGAAARDTVYDLASLTKPLATGLLLALLEAEGRIDPGSPLDVHLEAFRGTPYASRTLLDLACHRAGLPAWRPLYVHAADLPGYLARIAAEPPVTAAALYSDLGYIVLGAVLERCLDASLADAFRSRVAAPLGLASTGFGPVSRAAPTERGNEYERRLAGREGRGHVFRRQIPGGEVHDANAHHLGGVAGHAGLFGTVDEVAAIGGAMLGGELPGLTEAARRRLLEPQDDASGRSVGFVVARADAAARGILPDAAPGHTGFTGTSLWLDPPGGRLWVLLTNRVHPVVPEARFAPVRRGFHRIAVR